MSPDQIAESVRPEDFGPGWYSEDKSPWCDIWNPEAHKRCSGRFTLFEMDYINMRCACSCHRRAHD